MTVESTLADRTPKYGDFKDMSRVAQVIKYQIRAAGRWMTMTPSMHEALDMIALKLARIACGDPTVIDSWHDIAGYAMLIERELKSGVPASVSDVTHWRPVPGEVHDEHAHGPLGAAGCWICSPFLKGKQK